MSPAQINDLRHRDANGSAPALSPAARSLRRRPANQPCALAPATTLPARSAAVVPNGPATRPPTSRGKPAPNQGRTAIKLHGLELQKCPQPNSEKSPRLKLTKLPLKISPLLPVSPRNQTEIVHGKSAERYNIVHHHGGHYTTELGESLSHRGSIVF